MNVSGLGLGRALRDDGLARAVRRAHRDWKIAVRAEIANLPVGWEGTGEDIRVIAEAACGRSASPHAWGGLIMGAIKAGLLYDTGLRTQMADPRAHARTTAIYGRV